MELSLFAQKEFVDLGLSVKWATCNVGTKSPKEYGKLYLFDEAKLFNAKNNRLPTVDEMEELVKSCTWKWTTQNGVNGYIVTNKRNGNSIFLPDAGQQYDDEISQVGEVGMYLSWTESKPYPYYVWDLKIWYHYGKQCLTPKIGRDYNKLSLRLVQDVK